MLELTASDGTVFFAHVDIFDYADEDGGLRIHMRNSAKYLGDNENDAVPISHEVTVALYNSIEEGRADTDRKKGLACGSSYCYVDDPFDRTLGIDIALGRALKDLGYKLRIGHTKTAIYRDPQVGTVTTNKEDVKNATGRTFHKFTRVDRFYSITPRHPNVVEKKIATSSFDENTDAKSNDTATSKVETAEVSSGA